MQLLSSLLTGVQSLLGQNDRIDDAESVLYTLARTIEAKDPSTRGHADRVAHYAVSLGRDLKLSGKEIETLRKGGKLHDIGKIAIPDSILLKPGRFSPEEYTTMKAHPVVGCEICERLRSVSDAIPLIRYHHERLDGSGYPDGLKNGAISPLVRIISIVDIFDALRSVRVYKEAYSIDKTFEVMWEEAHKGWWDKDILTSWESLVRSGRHEENGVHV